MWIGGLDFPMHFIILRDIDSLNKQCYIYRKCIGDSTYIRFYDTDKHYTLHKSSKYIYTSYFLSSK